MNETNEIAAALCAAQAAMKPATRTGTNPHYRSRYASLADIWEAAREPITANGLAVAQLPLNDDHGRVGITTMLLHKSGQTLQSTIYATPQQATPQGIGSTLTYLRRYGLAAMLGIVADEDDDAEAGSRIKKASAPPPTTTNTEIHKPEAMTIAEVEQAWNERQDKDTFKALCKALGATAADVTRAFGPGGVQAWLKADNNRTPAQAARALADAVAF